MSGINQIALSLIRRNAPYRGPRTSDSWNDTIDEISNDLASVISEWNLNLYPLLEGVPDGTEDVNIDAFTNGLDGSQLYVDHDSTEADDNGAYWNETYSRPITVKESLTEIREEIESNYNDLAALVAEASGALTHDQKRAIGLEIFSDDYTFTGVSILTRSQNNEYNSIQLAKDIYGPSFSLDNDGLANFSNSINDALDAILTLHQGTWPSDVTLIHDIVNADVNANAAIVQTKLDDSGAGAIDTFNIGVDPVETLLDDLNVVRTLIRILKGTANWGDDILEPYVGGPVDLSGHIWDSGTGTRAANNPHGLTFDDVEGTDIDYIRSVLGINNTHQVPPYALFGATFNYIDSDDSLTEAVVKLDTNIASVGGDASAHIANLNNPHVVTAVQIGADNIITEVNTNGTLFVDWARVNKTGSSIADLTTKSHTLLTDIGTKTHATIDSEINTNISDIADLRTDVDAILAATYLEAADITYSFLDSAVGFGTTANTICAGDDSRFGAPVTPLDHGNEAHTSQFIDTTHIQGYGSAPPPSGEHYATDIYVEDSAGNFSSNSAEQILADIFGGSVKTLSANDIYAKHTFDVGIDFTMDNIANANHQDLVVDDLRHTDIVAPAATDLQHDELVVNNVNVFDLEFPGASDLSGFDVGETATQAVSGATGKVVYVDDVNDFITVSDFGTGTWDTTNLVSAPGSASIVPDVVGTEYAAYAINDTVTGTGGSGATGTIIYIDGTTDTIWINPTSGTFLDTDYVDNGDIGLAEIDTSGVTQDVDTYKPLDQITTDAGATAEVIETSIGSTLIRVRDLVGTVTATDVVSNPRSPIQFTVQSATNRAYAVGNVVTGATEGSGTIKIIDEPNKTLKVLNTVAFSTIGQKITDSTSGATSDLDSLPAVASSFFVGDAVTGTTGSGTVTDVTGSVLSIGDITGTITGTIASANGLGSSTFSGSAAQAPFATTSSELVTNLNADLLDGLEGSAYGALAVNNTWTKAQAVSQVTLTDAATIAVDASLSNTFTVTLGGNRTLGNPTNLISGGTYIIHINQDGTPPRTLSYDTLYKFPGGTVPTLSTTANAKDTLTCVYDGSVLRCAMQLDFK